MADIWDERFRADYRVMRVSRATGNEVSRVANVTGGSITRNQDTSVYESATLDYVGKLDTGTDLLRIYLDATDERTGETVSTALGTYLPSTPKRSVEGSRSSGSADLYGRLRELSDDDFETAYSVDVGSNAVETAAAIVRACGLEVIADSSDFTVSTVWVFGAGSDYDSKLDAVNALLNAAGFSAAKTDPYGRVLMQRYTAPADKVAVRSYVEGAGCKVLVSLTDELDRLDVSNVVMVDYTTQDATYRGMAVDDDPMSEWSTVSVGRRIVKHYSYNELPDGTDESAAQATANLKAAELLESDRSILRRLTFTTTYAPITVGDAVNVRLPTAGVSRRYVIRTQDIDLGAGCTIKHEGRNFDKS